MNLLSKSRMSTNDLSNASGTPTLTQASTTIFLRMFQETVEVPKEVRRGHAHIILESRTNFALDGARVDPLDFLHRPFLHGLEFPDRPYFFEGNGLEGDNRSSRRDVTPDWCTDNFLVGT